MRKKVFALAKKLGARVDINCEDRGRLDVEVTAPKGFCWSDSGLHCLVGAQWPHERAEEVWKDLLERMGDGVETCDKPNSACNGDCKNGVIEMIGIEQPS
jgi:hypothetical protein